MKTQPNTAESSKIFSEFIGLLVEVSTFCIDMQIFGEIDEHAFLELDRADWRYDHFVLQLGSEHDWEEFDFRMAYSPSNSISHDAATGIHLVQAFEVRFPKPIMELLGHLAGEFTTLYPVCFELELDLDGFYVWSGFHGCAASIAHVPGGSYTFDCLSNECLHQLFVVTSICRAFMEHARQSDSYNPADAECQPLRDARSLLMKLPELMRPDFQKYITHFHLTDDIEVILKHLRE